MGKKACWYDRWGIEGACNSHTQEWFPAKTLTPDKNYCKLLETDKSVKVMMPCGSISRMSESVFFTFKATEFKVGTFFICFRWKFLPQNL